MTFFQAIAYFAVEATLNLVRSWKVSFLAILTIAVSLFLAGVFLLIGGNLRALVEGWYEEGKIVVYLEADAEPPALAELRRTIATAPWVTGIETISGDVASRRFRESFPSLEDLLEGWSDDPLPASLEVGLDWGQLAGRADVEPWLAELRAHPEVAMVDDDRDWLGQMRAVSYVIDGLGMVLGTILLITAVFTISSVIRLTAYLYRDEISVMRLVGATEFFIRGPFYLEGFFQGLIGGGLAVVVLLAGQALLIGDSPESLWAATLVTEFLSAGQLAVLVGLGGLAGLIGAVASLRREDLGNAADLVEEE